MTNPIAFVFTYSLGFGFGGAFTYSAALNSAVSHLKGRKGLVSGIVVSALGFGGFLYS